MVVSVGVGRVRTMLLGVVVVIMEVIPRCPTILAVMVEEPMYNTGCI